MQQGSHQRKPLLPRGVVDTLAGSFGGMALVVVGYPFDTIKVRMQTSGRFSGMMDCVRQTVRNEGFGGFYKGVGSPLVGVTGVNAVAFFSYNQGLLLWARMFNQGKEVDRTEYHAFPYLMSGALTGVALSFVEGPVELFKSKLQVQYDGSGQYRGSLDCAWKIFRNHGVRGVYQGLGATLARNIPANIAYFAFYEYLKYMLGATVNPDAISPMAIMAAGGLAGAAYWVSSYPLDVIKSKMQIDHSEPAKRTYRNMFHTAKQLYATGGIKPFFVGFTPCLLRSFPANGACFLVYEATKKWMEKL